MDKPVGKMLTSVRGKALIADGILSTPALPLIIHRDPLP